MTAKVEVPIICDTREQAPFKFKSYDCRVTVGTLHTGDYSVMLPQIEFGITIERKTLNDLIGCFTQGRARFENELERMKPYLSCAVVVESPFRAMAKGDFHSAMQPYAAVQSMLSMSQKFRVPFFFAESRRQAEFIAYHLLRHFYLHNR